MTRPSGEPEFESEYPSAAITDSRRLMGPNLMHAGLGAVLDVSLDDADPDKSEDLLAAWHSHVSFIATLLQWPDAQTVHRVYPGGASLFVCAPIDQLMTATEVTEAAWVLAEAEVGGGGAEVSDQAMASIAAFSLNESNHALRAIWDEATRLGLNVTFDETTVCVGSGVGAQCWPMRALPGVADINWPSLRDIPIVLVTGSNGKTTVVRMVAAMAKAAGHTVGYTCTDGVWIGDAAAEAGDWSGPAGARRVLQDKSVTLAVLETARGGILRRGLAMQRAAVAAIVTLSPDHFGDYGITDLAALAEAKLAVGRAVDETGTLVYNASIPELVRALRDFPGRTTPVELTTMSDSRWKELGMTTQELTGIPATLGGMAIHNVLNAATALTIAHELHLGAAAIEALRVFGADPRENMGRLMVQVVGDVTVVVDYAHNAQGVAALIAATRYLPAARRAISLGTGGDRDDAALNEIAKAAVDSHAIDFYIAKEMPKFLRGRPPGSISATLIAALARLGTPAAAVCAALSDMDAARIALQWAQPGDLLLLGVHDQRDDVLSLLDGLARRNWHAGESLTV